MQDDQRCSGWGKNWLKNMKDWTGYPVQDLVTITQNRHEWKAFSAAMLPTDLYQPKDKRLEEHCCPKLKACQFETQMAR